MAIIHLAGLGGRALSAMKSSIRLHFACANHAIRSRGTVGVAKMSRRRSADKAIAISIALPTSLAVRLDQVLSYKQSRSEFIADAIKKKLDDKRGFSFDDVETEALVRYLLTRDIPNNIDSALRTYWAMITSSNPSEEV